MKSCLFMKNLTADIDIYIELCLFNIDQINIFGVSKYGLLLFHISNYCYYYYVHYSLLFYFRKRGLVKLGATRYSAEKNWA